MNIHEKHINGLENIKRATAEKIANYAGNTCDSVPAAYGRWIKKAMDLAIAYAGQQVILCHTAPSWDALSPEDHEELDKIVKRISGPKIAYLLQAGGMNGPNFRLWINGKEIGHLYLESHSDLPPEWEELSTPIQSEGGP